MEKLVAFDVEQHNAVLPHSALGGLTPDEVYFGTGEGVRERLAAAWKKAREERLAANRAVNCGACKPVEVEAHGPETPVIPGVLQMRTPESRMSS